MSFDTSTSRGMVEYLDALRGQVASGGISKAAASAVAAGCGLVLRMEDMLADGWNGSLSGKPRHGYVPQKAWTLEERKTAREALKSLRKTIRPRRKR